MLKRGTSYDDTLRRFAWRIPERFNIGTACSDAHADGSGKPALIFEEEAGRVATLSFDELARASNRFANLLAAHGIERDGDVEGGTARRALEEQVLEEVRRPEGGHVAVARGRTGLVAGTDAEPEPDCRAANARHPLGEHTHA